MAFEPRIVRPEDEDRGGDPHAGSRAPESRVPETRLPESRQPAPRFPGPRLSESRPAGALPCGSDRLMPRSDDLELPPDLEELAVQLSADAALLEQRYPAASARTRSKEPLVWRLARGAAAAMLVFGSMWWVSHRGMDGHRAGAARTASAAQGDAGPPRDAAVAPNASAADPPGTTISMSGALSNTPSGSQPQADAPAPVAGGEAGIASFDGPVREGSSSPPDMRVAAGDSTAANSGMGYRGGHVAELSFDKQADPDSRDPSPRDRIGMLEAQLSAFEKVIAKLQAEIRRRDQLLEESGELIKTLSAEVQSLRERQSTAERNGAAPDGAKIDEPAQVSP